MMFLWILIGDPYFYKFVCCFVHIYRQLSCGWYDEIINHLLILKLVECGWNDEYNTTKDKCCYFYTTMEHRLSVEIMCFLHHVALFVNYDNCFLESMHCIFWLAASAANPYTTRWVRRPAIYTATQSLAFGSGVAVGLIVRIETLLAIVCHRIFIIILVEYKLGLLGIQMYHGFKRLLNHTGISFAHL